MYTPNVDYFKWLLELANKYGIDIKDIDALSLVGFNIHVLADINDSTNFNSRQAIKESHVITANKLDSLYRHAREVDLFPTLSTPAEMNFILVITADDFNRVSENIRGDDNNLYRQYIIKKTNYISVGDYIFSFDYDIEIRARVVSPDEDQDELGFVQARYLIDGELPQLLNNHINPVLKLAKRKSVRGWEYHLYVKLKQYAREVNEVTFSDRDYNTFNYTASGELVAVKAYRQTEYPTPRINELAVKLYFENSRTSEDSIYMQYESLNTFSLIHKSQENGFRPVVGDRLITHIYTTTGKRGNFHYARQVGEGIEFIADSDTDLPVNVWIPDGKSTGGASYTQDKEVLRNEIITKKSTRSVIDTENDLQMIINNLATRYRNPNRHSIIKYRNDIRKIFNVFTTLMVENSNEDNFYIPTNTDNVIWDLTQNADAYKVKEGEAEETHYNLNSFVVTTNSPSDKPQVVRSTVETLVPALVEEMRLGLNEPNTPAIKKIESDGINKAYNALHISEDMQIPIVDHILMNTVQGATYFYENRLYKAKTTVNKDENEATDILNNLVKNTYNPLLKNQSIFEPINTLTYWIPYYLVYVRSVTKNFLVAYDQTVNKKYDLDYTLDKLFAPFSFICNWMRLYKPSIYSEYSININLRNNLTNISLKDKNILYDLVDGSVLDSNKLQVYLVLEDKHGNEVYVDKFSMVEYNTVPEEDDDYIDYSITLLPAGYIPKIVDEKMSIWSDLLESWVQVPIKDLKATVKVFYIDNVTEAIEYTQGMKLETDEAYYRMQDVPEIKSDDPNMSTNVALYYNVDHRNTKHLINHFSSPIDLLNDSTSHFKLQHRVSYGKGGVPVIEILQAPLIQYTFYKHFSSLYQRALEREQIIFNKILDKQRYQGEFSMALKFSNTYGFSKYYTIGKTRNQKLNNVQLEFEFLISVAQDAYLDFNRLSYTVAKYLESIKFENFEKFHISKLYDHIYNLYGTDTIEYIEFIDTNGVLGDNQLIQMGVDKMENDTVIEELNIPYVYDGAFKYNIKWTRLNKNKGK